MPDFNKVLDPGDVDSGFVNCVIEIPEGSITKVEWDRKRAAFTLDRVEPGAYPKPTNYGFIPQTLDEDGDELDVLLVTSQPVATGVWLKAKVIGVMFFQDGGEVDDKIICVPSDDRDKGPISSLAELGEDWKNKVTDHFTHYKDYKKPGTTIVKGWGNIDEAKQVIKTSIERFKKTKA